MGGLCIPNPYPSLWCSSARGCFPLRKNIIFWMETKTWFFDVSMTFIKSENREIHVWFAQRTPWFPRKAEPNKEEWSYSKELAAGCLHPSQGLQSWANSAWTKRWLGKAGKEGGLKNSSPGWESIHWTWKDRCCPKSLENEVNRYRSNQSWNEALKMHLGNPDFWKRPRQR